MRISLGNLSIFRPTVGAATLGMAHCALSLAIAHARKREMFGQKLRLGAELETKGGVRRPVRWACAQPLDSEGCLSIQLLPEDDRRWRKGI